MSGGRRIGFVVLSSAAREYTQVVILAETEESDGRLPGTVHTAVDRFDGSDFCVNDTGAIGGKGPREVPLKRFDVMLSFTRRRTLMAWACPPHLKRPRTRLHSVAITAVVPADAGVTDLARYAGETNRNQTCSWVRGRHGRNPAGVACAALFTKAIGASDERAPLHSD